MGKAVKTSSGRKRASRPAMSPEARENQMIALAVDLAEQQLRDGTASSQVITHFLKLGSTTERLERKIKEEQAKMLEAKTGALKSMQNMEEMYAKAVSAMRAYQGIEEEIVEDPDE